MQWEQRFLQVLRDSRPAYDQPPQWQAALALYDGLEPAAVAELDRVVVSMIDESYHNPHSSTENLPFDDVMVNLPAGMTPEDLLCVEAAAMVSAHRSHGAALFALNRLMRAPRWHAIYPRLFWLAHEGGAVQARLQATRAGRYLGAVQGFAAGDALGATLEFMSRRQVREAYPQGHREIIGGGPFGFAPGEWTDDTAMALAVARGIFESPADPVETVGRHFLAWYESGPPDVGATCRLAIEEARQSGSWSQASERVARELGHRAGGNGALMRTLPTPLAYGSETEQALRIARMTHPHPESDAAVVVYHRMVDALLQGADKGDSLSVGLSNAGPLTERLDRISHLTGEEVRATGYVVDTLEASIWAFLRGDSLEDCLVNAVNLGDDTDTVGAVAGGLAGAFYGAGALPRRWSVAMRNRSVLEEAAQMLYTVATQRGLGPSMSSR